MKSKILKSLGLLLKKVCYNIIQDKDSKDKKAKGMEETVSYVSGFLNDNVDESRHIFNFEMKDKLELTSESFAKNCLHLKNPEQFVWRSLSDKRKNDESRWQQFNTPDLICNEMVKMYKESFSPNDKILILFNLELVKAFILNYDNISYSNIYFVADSKEDFYWIKKHFNLINIVELKKFDIETLNKQIGEFNMKKFDVVFSNPPYEGTLHLKIINEAIKNSKEVIAIHPAKWFEDPLYNYKNNKNTVINEIQNNLKERMNEFKFIEMKKSKDYFNITISSDLMISHLKEDNDVKNHKIFSDIAESCLLKIIDYAKNCKFYNHKELDKIDGIRVKMAFFDNVVFGSGNGNAKGRMQDPYRSIDTKGPYLNGYNIGEDPMYQGKYHIDCYKKGGPRNSVKTNNLKASIRFNTKEEALNFQKSCNCNFWVNWNYLTLSKKYPLYMNDYSHIWTDEDYCKFFKLTSEESKFMSRHINDYREIDFINY